MNKLKKFIDTKSIKITKDLYDTFINYSKVHNIMYACWFDLDEFSLYSLPRKRMQLDTKGIIKLFQNNTLVICGSIIDKLNDNTCMTIGASSGFVVVPIETLSEEDKIIEINLED